MSNHNSGSVIRGLLWAVFRGLLGGGAVILLMIVIGTWVERWPDPLPTTMELHKL